MVAGIRDPPLLIAVARTTTCKYSRVVVEYKSDGLCSVDTLDQYPYSSSRVEVWIK